jgi:hypothetical protein
MTSLLVTFVGAASAGVLVTTLRLTFGTSSTELLSLLMLDVVERCTSVG